MVILFCASLIAQQQHYKSVICEHCKCLFHWGRHSHSCTRQHLRVGYNTLQMVGDLYNCMVSEVQGKQNQVSEKNWQVSAYTLTRVNGGPCGDIAKWRALCWHLIHEIVSYHLSSKLWRIVINVCNSDDSCGCVGEAIHGVALHVCCLDDQRVLRHFL